MTKSHQTNYPPALRLIQIINYIAAISSILLAFAYLFASKDFVFEINGGIEEPINRYIVACGYLAITLVASFTVYVFRKRVKQAPEFYVIANVLGFAIYEIIYHFSNYNVPLFEYISVYFIEAAIIAYLLLNKNVKAYFQK